MAEQVERPLYGCAAALEEKEQRIQELERRLREAETNLQALVSQQIDAVLTSANTVPLLLRQAQQALQRSNEALERRVADRTVELELANLALIRELEERQRVEEALRESEEKFHSAFEHAAIGFAMTLPDGRFVDANPAYCALTGYSIEELKTSHFIEMVHPDDYEQNMALNERLSARAIDGFVVENRYRRKDGQTVWVRKSISQVRGADGAPRWNIALVENITERKLAEAALRESEAALRAAGEALNERNQALEQAHAELTNERNRLLAVMEVLPVGMAIINESGGLHQTNRAFENVWGSPLPGIKSVDEYRVYRAWWAETGRLLEPEEWASARAVQKGETVTGQFLKIQHFSGGSAYVLNSAAPIYDAQGRVSGSAVAIMDITEFVQTQNALRESEERFRVALSALPMTVYILDRDLRYTWIYNPREGMTREQILGKRDDELFPREAAAEFIAVKQSVIDHCQSVQREVAFSHNGQTRTFLLSLEPICDGAGQVTGLIGASLDVTEQKRIEVERVNALTRAEVQRQLLENRERERQEIARDLHDGPIQLLSATIFHLQVARETVQDPLMKLELEQAVLNLKGAVRELRETMNELRPPAIIRFGLAKSARMYAEDFREKHPELKVSLHLFEDGELLPETVRLALFRIFQESLNNIVKHAGASRVSVRLTRKGNEVRLQIHDNGKGFIVPTDLLWQTQSGHYGLAGMKERAEAVGGRFTVNSTTGQGTTCLVVVPVDLRAA